MSLTNVAVIGTGTMGSVMVGAPRAPRSYGGRVESHSGTCEFGPCSRRPLGVNPGGREP